MTTSRFFSVCARIALRIFNRSSSLDLSYIYSQIGQYIINPMLAFCVLMLYEKFMGASSL